MVELDDVDRGVLHELQVDARKKTAQEIADKVGVSASTVRNRIEHLENEGVIEGYYPKIDYEKATLPLQILFVCTADPIERTSMVEDVLGVQGVIDVREMLTGHRNLYVEVIGTSTEDITRITDAIHALGLEIESSEIMRQRRVQPFNHFYLSADHTSETEQSDE
ncbi:Lrp/AsnC family transcriptional regulator [Halegenticoccus tardaugens]|uniref:Lrp/AsnC family transcriptional regulator n=1 Tax=Halegenticoccus tardaugens TaxID=2071624 RepID=UPI00100AA2A6|nr:winged helix-turn-helix transcriptional regulator [Halegenticoccus tardaugens]